MVYNINTSINKRRLTKIFKFDTFALVNRRISKVTLTWDIGSLLKHRIWPFCFLCHRIELYHFQFLKEAGNKNRRFELTNCDHDKRKTLKSVSWERLMLVNVNSNTFKQSYCWIWSKKENWGLFGLHGFLLKSFQKVGGTQRQFSENICSEDDLKSRTFGTFVVKFLPCLPLLGFSNI